MWVVVMTFEFLKTMYNTGKRSKTGDDGPAAKKAHPEEDARPRGFDRGLQVSSVCTLPVQCTARF